MAALAVVGLGTGVRADEASAARERAQEILEDDYQRELPTDPPDVDEPARGCGSPASGGATPPGPAGILAEILLYALLGALVLALAVAIGREVTRRTRGADDETIGAEIAEAEAPLPHLDEAEALAERGRFDEATHLLLQRVLAWLSRREGRPLPASLTSREVLRAASLRGERRQALEALVVAVEHSLFGGQPVGRAEWDRCLGAYRRLAETLGAA
ncbi:MAG: DUF4129 domain-containing protein [Myxococcota bacterium]